MRDLDDKQEEQWPYEGLGEFDASTLATAEVAITVAAGVTARLQAAVDELARVRSDPTLTAELRPVAVRRARKECQQRAAALVCHVKHTATYLSQVERLVLDAPAIAAHPHFATVMRDLLAAHGNLSYAHAEAEMAGSPQHATGTETSTQP